MKRIDTLNEKYSNSNIFNRDIIKRKLSRCYDELDEFRLRDYAVLKVKKKVLDK